MRNGFSLPYSPPPDQYPEFCQLSIFKIKGRLMKLKFFLFKVYDTSKIFYSCFYEITYENPYCYTSLTGRFSSVF
jgi:hypothetical protein